MAQDNLFVGGYMQREQIQKNLLSFVFNKSLNVTYS